MSNSNQDPVKPTSNTPAKPGAKKELSMEMRLVIAFVLMGAVLFLTPYFIKTPSPAPAAKKQETAQSKDAGGKDAAKDAAQPTPASPAKPAAPAATPPAGAIAAERQDDGIVLETDLYRVTFSNRGAVVRSWVLKKFLDSSKKQVELVNPVGGTRVGFPLGLIIKGTQPSTDPNQALYRTKPSPDGLRIEFEFSDGKVHVRKSFSFEKDRYLVQIGTEVNDRGRPAPHLISWRGGFGDFTVTGAIAAQHSLFFDAASNKLEVNEAKVAKDGPVSVTGKYHFAGLEDTYFTAVVLPPSGVSYEVQTLSDKLPVPSQNNSEELHIGIAIGGDGVNNSAVFVGPKDIDLLKRVDPRLEQVVDFGWFAFIAKPLFLALNYTNDKYIHNYGWSIVVVTVLINILMLPLKISNLNSMKKMSVLQPEIKKIQDKYSNLPMRDPRRQQQQEETMALYKKHGVNPLGGCVPMLLQMPFFFAFYKVLSVTIEMRGAPWLWVTDLSQPETIAVRMLPLITVATQFVMQKMTPTTTADPQQQRMMMLMPLMFVFIFYSSPSGLVLYWLTGNVVGIAQQWFFNRLMPSTAPVKLPEQPKKKK
ncbi:MAG: membrane protein insertase YidC [Acidobacteria bacterium]|nr:membrane protein insertase YidC [Acidobacteriota bacterium]